MVWRQVAWAMMATAVIGGGTGCHTEPSTPPWSGIIDSHNNEVDFYGHTFDSTDVKVLCDNTKRGLRITLIAPDGTRVSAIHPADGSQKSDINVESSKANGSQTLSGGAVWVIRNDATGFILDTSGQYDRTFYLHDGGVLCPAAPRS